MTSRRPLVPSLAASLARSDLHCSISEGVARPRLRIDFSRFISSRLESPLRSFAGGLVSVEVAMKPSPWSQAGRRDEAELTVQIFAMREVEARPRRPGERTGIQRSAAS